MAVSSGLGISALLPGSLGFRNKIINGDFGINQRAFTSTTTNGSFGFDRWSIGTNGGTGTYSTQAFTVGNAISGYEPINFARIVTSGQTGGNYAQLSQKIEDVRTCAGQQVTISFYAKTASGTPKVSVELQQLFGSGGSPSSNIFTYAGQVTLSTSWVRHTITVVVPSISGKTIGTTNDHSLVLNFFVSAGSGLEARSGSLGIQNNTFDFWGVQLEQNYQPTPFEQRPIGTELALCQRYFWSLTTKGQGQIMGAQVSQYGNACYLNISSLNPVPMRVAPTPQSDPLYPIASYSPFVTDFNSNLRAISAINLSSPYMIQFVYNSTQLTPNSSLGLNFADVNRTLWLSAEL